MYRALHFVVLLIISWCVMTFTHEMGHSIGGWCSGAILKDADLLPWHLPYSFFEPDPRPLVTLWSGPILGVAIPLSVALLVRTNRTWFIANFCTIANGTYLATAWISNEPFLDTPKLLEHGASPMTVFLYCTVTIGFGYFGFRRSCQNVLSNGPVQQREINAELPKP